MIEPTCRCISCGWTVPLRDAPGRTCPRCGPLAGITEVIRDLDSIVLPVQRPFGQPGAGIFRFAALLPVEPPGPRLPLIVGDTPLYDAPRLARRLGVAQVLVKDDGRNPSASLKDRASALAVAHALALSRPLIAAASTGNAASSVALLAASAGLRAILFVPAQAPRPKVAQMLLAGAVVVQVQGSYDRAYDLCALACERFGWYSRNTATNPVLSEGKKTVAFEIAESCGWDPPDLVAVGVGDGCVFGAIHKGFQELFTLGFLRRIPRLIGVQAEGCAPLVEAFSTGSVLATPVPDPQTYADSISVGVPRDQVKALRAARESGGLVVAVPDDRIRQAQRLLAREAGVFAEPAGAAGLAGLLSLAEKGQLDPDARVAVVVSGHALKDVNGAMSAVSEEPISVSPDPADIPKIRQAVERRIGEDF